MIFEMADYSGVNVFSSEDYVLGLPIAIALATLTFSASIVFSLRILLPSPGWRFEDSPSAMIEHLGGRTDSEVLRRLAVAKEQRFDKNEVLMVKVRSDLFFGVCATFAQIPLWVLSVSAM
ncbi:MAG: hypothetical protein RLN85_12680 [Pseudomonadales bacterium]